MRSQVMMWAAAMLWLGGPACGDDEPASKAATDAGPGADPAAERGSSGQGSAAAGRSGSAGATPGGSSTSGLGAAASVECGDKTCTSPGGGFASACCADPATGSCGMSFMGAGCSVPEPGDERCPSVMGFVTLPSCCTDVGMCGISAAMFGMPGCIELSEAAARAQMSSASSFPAPQRCDGSSVDRDGDAGAPDADGGA